MLDFAKVKELAELRGESLTQLSNRIGANRKYLYHVDQGRTPASRVSQEKIELLAAALHVPTSVIWRSPSETVPTIHRFFWDSAELIDVYWMAFRKMASCLTINSRPDSFALPRSMYKWLYYEHDPPSAAKSKTGVDPEWERWAQGFYETQMQMRRNSKIEYTLVTREQLYRDAGKADPIFLEQSFTRFREIEEKTQIGLVSDLYWQPFYSAIAELISKFTCVPPFRWNKISIIDDFILMVRAESFHYYVSFDKPTICSLRKSLTQLATEAVQWDPSKLMANTYSKFARAGVKGAKRFRI